MFATNRIPVELANVSLFVLCGPPPEPGQAFLREVLEPKGITQSQLAKLTGTKAKYINNVVRGEKPFTIKFAARVKKALDVDCARYMQLQIDLEHWRRLRDKEGAHPRKTMSITD